MMYANIYGEKNLLSIISGIIYPLYSEERVPFPSLPLLYFYVIFFPTKFFLHTIYYGLFICILNYFLFPQSFGKLKTVHSASFLNWIQKYNLFVIMFQVNLRLYLACSLKPAENMSILFAGKAAKSSTTH